MLDSLREIFTLDQSTVRSGRRSFNLVVKAVIVASTLMMLILISLAWNQLIKLLSWPLGIDEYTQFLMTNSMLAYVVLVSMLSIIMASFDVFRFALRDIFDGGHGDEQR